MTQHTTTLTDALALHRSGHAAQAAELYDRLADTGALRPRVAATLIRAAQHGTLAETAAFDVADRVQLGEAFAHLGWHDMAISILEQAVAGDPARTDAHLVLARARDRAGDRDRALLGLDEALETSPDDPNLHAEVGILAHRAGTLERALHHLTLALAGGASGTGALVALDRMLPELSFPGPNRALEATLAALLSAPAIDPQTNAAAAAARLLAARPEVHQVAALAARGAWADIHAHYRAGFLTDFLASPLLVPLLATCIVPGPTLPPVMVGVRRALLRHYTNDDLRFPPNRDLIAALARWALRTGFPYPATSAEAAALDELASRLEAALADPAPDPEATALGLNVLGMYEPLFGLTGLDGFATGYVRDCPGALADGLQALVLDVARERAYRRAVTAINRPTEPLSERTRDLMDTFPGPRWSRVPVGEKRSVGAWLAERIADWSPPATLLAPARVLVAGCGTGRTAIELAGNCHIRHLDAVDLSSWALAYAARQADDLLPAADRLQMRFLMGDLLDPRALDGGYDLIVADDLLNHVASPERALRTLAPLLSAGGAIWLGLYADPARRDAVAARKLAHAQGIQPGRDGLIAFRKLLADTPDANVDHAALQYNMALHSVPDFATFIAPVQEHRFTFRTASDMMQMAGLHVAASVLAPPSPQSQTLVGLDDPAMIAGIERQQPNIIAETYRFLVTP